MNAKGGLVGRASGRFRILSTALLPLAAALCWAACSDSPAAMNPLDGNTAGAPLGGAGVLATAGGGAAGVGGGAGQAGTGGNSASSGGTGGVAAGNAGASGASGAPQAGSGEAGAGAGGSGSETGCTRELLAATVDDYFTAMAAHDPSSLPLSPDVKFTEDAGELELGEGIWQTAGELKFKRSALDTETCGTVTEAVLDNDGDDFVFGLRLKLEDQQITEVETILVGPDGWFPNPMAVINSADDDWETVLPEGERASREELGAIVDAYFELFADGDLDAFPFASDCVRAENGFSPGACNFGISSFGTRMVARQPVTDVEAGIAIGFVLFAGNLTDFHMFKVRGGEVHGVRAVVGPSVSSSGWSD